MKGCEIIRLVTEGRLKGQPMERLVESTQQKVCGQVVGRLQRVNHAIESTQQKVCGQVVERFQRVSHAIQQSVLPIVGFFCILRNLQALTPTVVH